MERNEYGQGGWACIVWKLLDLLNQLLENYMIMNSIYGF